MDKYEVYHLNRYIGISYIVDSESMARKKCLELNTEWRSFGWTFKKVNSDN